MVILAIYTTNIIHPGVYLSSANPKFTMSMENLSGTGDAWRQFRDAQEML